MRAAKRTICVQVVNVWWPAAARWIVGTGPLGAAGPIRSAMLVEMQTAVQPFPKRRKAAGWAAFPLSTAAGR